MNIHIDIKTLDITYYKVMNTKHGKLRIHEHKHKHGHKTQKHQTYTQQTTYSWEAKKTWTNILKTQDIDLTQ
jgi:hypothetical protein